MVFNKIKDELTSYEITKYNGETSFQRLDIWGIEFDGKRKTS